MTVRREKEILLRVIDGRACVLVDGPVVFSCDTDDEAIVLKNALEMLPETLGFAYVMAREKLSLPRVLLESWNFVVGMSGRYSLDTGVELRESRALWEAEQQKELPAGDEETDP